MTSEELTERLLDPDGLTSEVRDQLLALREFDLAELLNRLPLVEAAAIVRVLPERRASSLFDQASLRRRSAILEQLEPALAARILEGVSADERTQILRQLSPRDCHRLLPNLKPSVRQAAERLLTYPPRTAGGIMTTEFVRLDPAMTAAQALAFIRSVAGDMETIYACYVSEPDTGSLVGAGS